MVRVQDEPDWVVIGDAPDRPGLAGQRSRDYVPPRWPGADGGQQMHLDIRPVDLDAAEREVLAMGASRIGGGGEGAGEFRAFADPAGHPFCLIR